MLSSYLSGRAGPIASWGSENIHIFIVASLAVVAALPADCLARRLRRLLGSAPLVLFYTVVLTVVQMKTVMERYAEDSLRITLTTHYEKLILNLCNRSLIMVGMIALPACLFLFSYVSLWQVPDSGTAVLPRSPHRAIKESGWLRSWDLLAGALFAVASIAAVTLSPPPAGPEEILAGLRRVIVLNPFSAQAHFSLALQLEDQGKLPQAQASYEAALREEPSLVPAWFNLGNVYFKQEEFGEAVRCYREAIQRDARHASARSNLGNALFRQARYKEAVDAYQAALKIDEGRASTHNNLGEALLRLNRPCEALVQFERVSELDKNLSVNRGFQRRFAALQTKCRLNWSGSEPVPSGGTTP